MDQKLESLEKILGVKKFKKSKLLQTALTHRSYLNETNEEISSNERLEFLGDAVLELIVSDFLYNKYPNYTEGKLTSLRSAIVNTNSLAKIANKINLGEFLLLSHGEESGGGRKNYSLLADVFESILGAVYLDQGYEEVNKLLKNILFPLIEDINKKGGYSDFKSLLQEKTQERYKLTPNYKVVAEEGPDHNKTFFTAVFLNSKKLGEGMGKNKQEAEQNAAKIALEGWEE